MKKVWPVVLTFGAILSSLFTFCVYYTSKDNQFVALDDYAYIVNNQYIEKFDWNTFLWAITSFHEGNWHPLTMLSLALDRYLWGLNPYGFHLTNIVLHCCSVFCSCFLFSYLLRAANSYTYRKHLGGSSTVSKSCFSPGLSERGIVIGSVAAALFFGLHPLRVESVVWASERKDVLCMLLMITSIWMYIRYTLQHTDDFTWFNRYYLFSLLLAVFALMSKPLAVSLPLILIIIDWYPLGRTTDKRAIYRLLLEKIPFFCISVINVVLTLFAQQIAMKYAPDVGLTSRLFIASKALCFYIIVTIWPTDLSAFYMHPGDVAESALAQYIPYFISVVFITLAFFWVGCRQRIWLAFWLFYVITLVPMLGLVQVGGQWAADRYSYLPSLGIALLWGAWVAHLSEGTQKRNNPVGTWLCIILAVGQLSVYTVQTVHQIRVWHSTETLASRIIDIMPHQSGAPYLARAMYRNETGRYEQALDDIEEAMKIALHRGQTRTYSEIAFEQAVILRNLGRVSEALNILEWGIQVSVDPVPPDAQKLRDDLIHQGLNEGRARGLK